MIPERGRASLMDIGQTGYDLWTQTWPFKMDLAASFDIRDLRRGFRRIAAER